MAALSALSAVEAPNRVWQRVTTALYANKATEQTHKFFRELKMYLATQGRNPQLRFSGIDATSAVIATDGAPVGAGVTTIYGLYYKKSGTDDTGTATDTFLKIFDDGTDDDLSGLAASVVAEFSALVAGDENVHFWPKGLAIANGIRYASVTAQNGLTIATAANSGNGFIISGGAVVN